MKHKETMEILDRKFTSGNSCEVTRASITREEYLIIKDMQGRLESGIASLYQIVEEPELMTYIEPEHRLNVAVAVAGEAYLRLKGEYL